MAQLTKIQMSCQTKFTRTGERDMKNKKPYRTPGQKLEARKTARLINGTFVSSAPVSYHG